MMLTAHEAARAEAVTAPARRLADFLAKYSPEVRAVAKGALVRMRQRLPGAIEFVYDNYNALVIGFGPTERPSEALLSIVLYPRWVNLCFLQDGPSLHDPHRLLRGNGKVVRTLRLASGADLDTPPVRALIAQATASADPPTKKNQRRKMIIRAVSARQRPRRPRSR